MPLTVGEIINIALCCLSFLLAAISIIFVVLTLRQNSKMIESSTRPYISIYGRVTNFQRPSYYIVLKNFGTSNAEIISLNYSPNFKHYCLDNNHIPFSNISGSHIAPGQSTLSNLDAMKFSKDMEPFDFKVSYKTTKRTYHESFIVDPRMEVSNIQTRASTSNDELKIISYTIQDLVEKHL